MLKKEFEFPLYNVMVRNLFKVDIPGNRADLMHAAIGIAGECGEISTAVDRANLIEEFGDIEFYMVALEQRMEHHGYPMSWNNELGVILNPANVFWVMSVAGSDILDSCKKGWIYNDKQPKVKEINEAFQNLRMAMDYAYGIYGLDKEEILYQNQIKLIGKDGRYKSGQYSDAAALAREDKKVAPEGIVTPNLTGLGDGSVTLSPASAPGLAELDELATKFLDSREETVQVHSTKDDEHKPRFAEVLSNTKIKE